MSAAQVAPVQPAVQAPVRSSEPAPADPRLYRGLFGGAGPAPGLSLILSGSGGYDTNVLAAQPGGDTPGTVGNGDRFAGQFGDATSVLTYLFQGQRRSFNVSATSNLRYYPNLADPLAQSHSLAAGASVPVGAWTFAGTQSLHYSSFYHFVPGVPTLAPNGGAGPVTADSGVAELETISLDTALDVTQAFGPRNSIRYHFNRRSIDTRALDRQLVTMGGGAAYRRAMTRYGGLRIGYSYQQAQYSRGQLEPSRMHNIDSGFDYERPLSFSRRTTVGFSGGMQMLERVDTRFYRFQGSATVSHQFGRTWLLRAHYDRGAQFIDIVPDPMYSDTVTAHFGGFLVGRVLQLSIDGSYSDGRLSYTTQQSALVTYNGSANIEWALGEKFTFFGSYAYYGYDFGDTVSLAIPISRSVERHTVRGGVRVWFPLLRQRGQRGNR